MTLAAAATGSPTIAYQWRQDTVGLANGGRISGADTATLTITGAVAADAGSYDCVATSSCGSAASNAAAVGVCAVDMDCDGSITPIDIALFVNLWFTSLQNGTLAGDYNGDGAVTPADIAAFVNGWFNALTGGC